MMFFSLLEQMNMERKFKRLTDHRQVDIVEYIKEKLVENPDIELYIGCDSQTHGNTTTYATVVVLHHRGSGGHVLYNKETVPVIRVLWDRIWKEVESSLEIAEYLLENGVKKAKYIDIDINPDKRYKSNMLLTSAIGMITWKGFEVRAKPGASAASYAADRICK